MIEIDIKGEREGEVEDKEENQREGGEQKYPSSIFYVFQRDHTYLLN